MNEELACRICGKLASQDKHFYKERRLCNRHYLQIRDHGKPLDTKCIINPSRRIWSDDEVNYAVEQYNLGIGIAKIAEKLNTTSNQITYLLTERAGIELEVRFKNDCRYKAPYQEYEWCYQRYVIQGMSHQDMAEEAGCKTRTIQKWCSEIHKLNAHTRRKEYHLTDYQKQLIMFSLLGDGHIDKRETQPIFIVSHAINQKDYLFWKYSVLKNVCKQTPTLYCNNTSTFNGDKIYQCQDYYRFCTRILDDLIPIRNLSRSDIIKDLNEFGLSIHFLDDASCSTDGFWELCYAAFTDDEREQYRNILVEKFNIHPRLRKDERYIGFGKEDSKKISEIILRNIPNDLDIIKYKILKEYDYEKIC